jgi:hypothetical protein
VLQQHIRRPGDAALQRDAVPLNAALHPSR